MDSTYKNQLHISYARSKFKKRISFAIASKRIKGFGSVQFGHSVVSNFCDLMDCSTLGFPVHH